MLREKCAICKNPLSSSIYKQVNYPICISSSSEAYENDRFKTLNYLGCNLCGCVQLENLIDPSLLYAFSHNNTYETPTWSLHHKLFSEFIMSNTKERKFLEIGGSSGYLAELLHSCRLIEWYKILDLAKEPLFRIPIQYIQVNCEKYSFQEDDKSTQVIMSHVFEHLYNPRAFLEQLGKSNIESIFISIPNMKVCLEKEFLSFLHVEHTYYITADYLKRMMADIGFSCIKEENFKEHSIFFYFKRGHIDTLPPYPNAQQILDSFHTYYRKRDSMYSHLVLTQPTYIVPGGHYGQLIYHYLREQKEYIIGFLDNDTTKVGKRMYGTDKYVYRMDQVLHDKDKKITIILNAGPYAEEIKTQLNEYHPDLDYISI